jgi:hypothetical protein
MIHPGYQIRGLPVGLKGFQLKKKHTLSSFSFFITLAPLKKILDPPLDIKKYLKKQKRKKSKT